MKTYKARSWLAAAAMLCCCHGVETSTATQGGWVIFSGANGRALFNQCSRGVPPHGQAQWTPTQSDIDEFEAALPQALSKQPEARDVDFSNMLIGWRRQYVGTVRGGKRFIYGNFFPADTGNVEKWQAAPYVVCDGGPSFFGAEFDVAARQVGHLDFNGVA